MSANESKEMEVMNLAAPPQTEQTDANESEPDEQTGRTDTANDATEESPDSKPATSLNPNAHEFTPSFSPANPAASPSALDASEVKDREDDDILASSPPKSSSHLPTKPLQFDNEAVLLRLISAQLEYFFSDYHLANDTYLLARMCEDPARWISIDTLSRMPRIRHLTSDIHKLKRALQICQYIEVSTDGTKARRPNYELPKPRPNRDLRRTIFVYGIPERVESLKLGRMLEKFGTIKRIHWDDDHEEGPNMEVSHLIMKKKLGPKPPIFTDVPRPNTAKPRRPFVHPDHNPSDPYDFGHLRCAFVVFQSQSQATKCVKARVRALDGMRAMHKYDYNKVAKKYASAKMKGEADALFSPTHVLPSPSMHGPSPTHIQMVSPMIQSSQDYDFDFVMPHFPVSANPQHHLLIPQQIDSSRHQHVAPIFDRGASNLAHFNSMSSSRRQWGTSNRHVRRGYSSGGGQGIYIDDILFDQYERPRVSSASRQAQSAPYGPIAAPLDAGASGRWLLDAHSSALPGSQAAFDMRDILEFRRLPLNEEPTHWTPTENESGPPMNATRVDVGPYGAVSGINGVRRKRDVISSNGVEHEKTQEGSRVGVLEILNQGDRA